MSYMIKEGDRLVLELGQASAQHKRAFLNLQLMPALLLGLLLPLMIATYFFPDILRHVRWPVTIVLVAMFAGCIAMFFYTVLKPGKIHAVAVDRASRTVELIRRNKVSETSQIVPFDDIDELRLRHRYDMDGIVRHTAEIVLRSQSPISLPGNASERELRPLRAAIGLG